MAIYEFCVLTESNQWDVPKNCQDYDTPKQAKLAAEQYLKSNLNKAAWVRRIFYGHFRTVCILEQPEATPRS